MSFVCPVLTLVTSLIPALPQADVPIGCGDTNAIQWFVPGEFDEAREKARAERRMLIVKGISFGVDEAGAKCATKGRW